MEHDRVRLCRPQHLEHSEKFTKALNESLGHPGIAITIPLRVHFVDLDGSANDYVEALLDIKEAEREIETRWSNYVPKENEANEVLTFRFVPEPMVVGIRYADMTLELVNAVENLVFAGVCFTQFAENLGMDLEDAYASMEATWQLLRCICDTSRCPHGPPNTTYHYHHGLLTGRNEPPQFGTLEVMCNKSMQERAFEAVCLAVVLTHSTTKFVFSMELMMDTGRSHWWKWVAYALFSKRARTSSSIETLVCQDANDFASILLLEHPEEELLRSTRGCLVERDATLIDGAPIQ